MPAIISLRDFLLTGEFGGIRHDTHPDHATSILGEPTHYYDEDSGVIYFLYGWYEIAFWDSSPMYVQNDHMDCHQSDRTFRNQHIKIDPWIFDRPTPLTKTEIVQALSDINASYRHVICNDRRVLQMESGVILDFNPALENPERIVCDAIWLSFPDFRRPVQEISG
jgi:hypothetical protein